MYVINNWQENMTAEKSNQYYAKLQDIYEQAPVLIDIHSLLVTPSGISNDSPRRLLAAWGQNLISFLLLEITRKYPVLNMDMLSGKENEYLQKVSIFIESHIDSKSLFFNPHGLVDDSLVNEKLKEFPNPAPTGDEELITIYQFIPRIAAAISLPETAQWRFLYQLSVEWQQQLVLGKFLLFPRQATRELLETFMKGYQNKRQRHHWNAIRWGAEYNRYYQSYLAQGYTDMAARGKARRQFVTSHPYPKTAAELLEDQEYPGTTAAAMRRYHTAFLAAKSSSDVTEELIRK